MTRFSKFTSNKKKYKGTSNNFSPNRLKKKKTKTKSTNDRIFH